MGPAKSQVDPKQRTCSQSTNKEKNAPLNICKQNQITPKQASSGISAADADLGVAGLLVHDQIEGLQGPEGRQLILHLHVHAHTHQSHTQQPATAQRSAAQQSTAQQTYTSTAQHSTAWHGMEKHNMASHSTAQHAASSHYSAAQYQTAVCKAGPRWYLIFCPFTWEAPNEQFVGGVLHHRAHNLQLVEVDHRIWLSEAQCHCNIVVIVVGSANLQVHTGLSQDHMWAHHGNAGLSALKHRSHTPLLQAKGQCSLQVMLTVIVTLRVKAQTHTEALSHWQRHDASLCFGKSADATYSCTVIQKCSHEGKGLCTLR